MQSKSSKCHHFAMHNFNAKVRVTVCFLDIAEGQINMAKLYFHGETTIFERLCTQLNVFYLHYILI